MAVALTGIFASFTSPWFPFLLCSVHGNRRRMKENPPPPLSPPPLHLYGVSSFLGENQYAWPVGPRARAHWARPISGRRAEREISRSAFPFSFLSTEKESENKNKRQATKQQKSVPRCTTPGFFDRYNRMPTLFSQLMSNRNILNPSVVQCRLASLQVPKGEQNKSERLVASRTKRSIFGVRGTVNGCEISWSLWCVRNSGATAFAFRCHGWPQFCLSSYAPFRF